MFRLSDYDFESCRKDYVAFMDVVKKFLTIENAINEPCRGFYTEDELLNHAEDFALEYIEARINYSITRKVSDIENIKALMYECINYLEYPCVALDEYDMDEIDNLLWDIYGDLS